MTRDTKAVLITLGIFLVVGVIVWLFILFTEVMLGISVIVVGLAGAFLVFGLIAGAISEMLPEDKLDDKETDY